MKASFFVEVLVHMLPTPIFEKNITGEWEAWKSSCLGVDANCHKVKSFSAPYFSLGAVRNAFNAEQPSASTFREELELQAGVIPRVIIYRG